jgi:hypothetical protein
MILSRHRPTGVALGAYAPFLAELPGRTSGHCRRGTSVTSEQHKWLSPTFLGLSREGRWVGKVSAKAAHEASGSAGGSDPRSGTLTWSNPQPLYGCLHNSPRLRLDRPSFNRGGCKETLPGGLSALGGRPVTDAHWRLESRREDAP